MDELLDPTVTDNKNFQGGMPRQLPNATATLVLGIISIVGCVAYGIVGLVCGIIALFLHKKDKALYETNPIVYDASFKNSKAGYICGIIGVCLSALYILILIFAFVFAFSMGGRFPR